MTYLIAQLYTSLYICLLSTVSSLRWLAPESKLLRVVASSLTSSLWRSCNAWLPSWFSSDESWLPTQREKMLACRQAYGTLRKNTMREMLLHHRIIRTCIVDLCVYIIPTTNGQANKYAVSIMLSWLQSVEPMLGTLHCHTSLHMPQLLWPPPVSSWPQNHFIIVSQLCNVYCKHITPTHAAYSVVGGMWGFLEACSEPPLFIPCGHFKIYPKVKLVLQAQPQAWAALAGSLIQYVQCQLSEHMQKWLTRKRQLQSS